MLPAPCFSLSSRRAAADENPADWVANYWVPFLSSTSARMEALRQGLSELGYAEGKSILIEWRGADNIREQRSALAEELVRLKVDVIVTAGSASTRAAKAATSTIPIVMASSDDPVGTGGSPPPGP